ncbi:hypothetical protein ACHAXT_002131 [Thalassiosira profunda]
MGGDDGAQHHVDAAASDDDADCESVDTVDSIEAYINFESIRNSEQLEEAITFSWPGIYEAGSKTALRKITISTLLEEDDLAPLFDGSRWAGTRLWGAAVRCIQYLTGDLPHMDRALELSSTDGVSMLELGCGLGVPGMIYHLLGNDVVLTDQADILSQLNNNITQNFPDTAKEASSEESASNSQHTIQAMPLSWSRADINSLLRQLGRTSIGFDVVINCDCVYEPLYGKSWHLLNETIDELLRVNPKCVVVSSMERRAADGIDDFLEEMRNLAHVESVEKVWLEEERQIEIYVTRGCSAVAQDSLP